LFKILAEELGKNRNSNKQTKFSRHEGSYLRKNTINLKIEKVKEFIQLGQLKFFLK